MTSGCQFSMSIPEDGKPGDSMLCPPTWNAGVETLPPNVVLLGGEAFGRGLGLRRWSPRGGISALVRGGLPHPHVRAQQGSGRLGCRDRAPPKPSALRHPGHGPAGLHNCEKSMLLV